MTLFFTSILFLTSCEEDLLLGISPDRAFALSGDGVEIAPTALPSATIEYLKQNYPSNVVIKAEIYTNGYEVTLDTKVKLEFDSKGIFREVSGNSDDSESNHIPVSGLPAAIQTYVTANYPGQTIIKAEKEGGNIEIVLSNGVKLEFDSNGKFIEVSGSSDLDDDSVSNHILVSGLPAAIQTYVTANYPGQTIIKAEKEGGKIEIVLSNGVKLEFDSSGKFIEVSGSSDSDDKKGKDEKQDDDDKKGGKDDGKKDDEKSGKDKKNDD